ncbi:MAG: long-chain fatty acid--CoA ligase [Myxococcales bacterium]|nr:long-chain fatty acid--CoA ligase [Myxococcales bacterium]
MWRCPLAMPGIEEIEPEEIIDHCARNLAPYKVPRLVEFCEKLQVRKTRPLLDQYL